jgi:DNA-binding transcriptional LysR family regulator
MADELDGMATFVAVAEMKGIRAAGERLGVSHSAVSQALRRLEERIGVSLVRRTTRSVHLTEAGERLYASVRPALDEVRAAVAAVGELGDRPRGTLRVHTSSAAMTMIGDSLLASFLTEHPHVQLDLTVSDAPVDIVAEGFDAGIQLGEVIDRDMIAVPVTGDLRLAVVGARPTSRGAACRSIRASWLSTTASTGIRRSTRRRTSGSSRRMGGTSRSQFPRASSQRTQPSTAALPSRGSA